MADQFPATYTAFRETCPDVFTAYEQPGSAVHRQGALDDATRALVMQALAIGVGAEGALAPMLAGPALSLPNMLVIRSVIGIL